jgi:hypothetical protein
MKLLVAEEEQHRKHKKARKEYAPFSIEGVLRLLEEGSSG